MGSETQANERNVAWATPEILGGASAMTREADMSAFGMVVIEVCPRPLLHPAFKLGGWMECLISECYPRFSREVIHSVNLQSRSSLQRLSMVAGRLACRRRKELV